MDSKDEDEEARLLREQNDNSNFDSASEATFVKPSESSPRVWIYMLISYLLNILLLILVAILLFARRKKYLDPTVGSLYSPAQDIVSYEIISFPESTENKSPYQANFHTGIPTDEADTLWEELYLYGMQTRIDEATARKLPNRTVEIPGESKNYVIQLDVFHQLHCLSVLRTLLWPDRYKHEPHTDYYLPNGERNYTSSAAKNYDHCLEYLRKSVMCHSDISVVYYDYTDRVDHQPSPHELQPHVCRNFEKVKTWARERMVTELKWPEEWKNGKPPKSAFSVLNG